MTTGASDSPTHSVPGDGERSRGAPGAATPTEDRSPVGANAGSAASLAAEARPRSLRPMLATPGPLPTGVGWTFELKWDGVRAIASIGVAPGALVVTSRNANDITETFPELAGLHGAANGHELVLDGEIVALDEAGRPSFARLQERLGVRGAAAVQRAQGNPTAYVVFDLLHLDGFSTRSLPLRDRRRLLEQVGLGTGPAWRIADQFADGEALLAATRTADLEGIIAKRLDGSYVPNARTGGWVKVKNLTVDEFLIGGWVPGDGARERTIGALLLGVPESDKPGALLRWVGRAGTGFSQAELGRLYALLSVDRTDTSPFVNDPGDPRSIYVTPRLRCRVEYREWTAQGVLRHPSYKGLAPTDPEALLTDQPTDRPTDPEGDA